MSLLLTVNIVGILFITFIVWWFWLYKPKKITKVSNDITVRVKDGAYQPAYIAAKVNQPITLRFIREDASVCAETVIFSALNISKNLPLNEAVELTLTIANPGKYEFTCQMAMYRGKLIVS